MPCCCLREQVSPANPVRTGNIFWLEFWGIANSVRQSCLFELTNSVTGAYFHSVTVACAPGHAWLVTIARQERMWKGVSQSQALSALSHTL